MGLIANIYRSDYDCTLNAFHGFQSVTLTNVEGPFEPTADRPAAFLKRWAPFGEGEGRVMAIVVPAEKREDGHWHPLASWQTMFGGTYCASSDSRFWQAVQQITGAEFCNGALPIHDRNEG
jgi:hypothetical protein